MRGAAGGQAVLQQGDCAELLRGVESESLDSLVTDPPSGIEFMGQEWDHHKGGRREWIAWLTGIMAEVYRVLKPGAHGFVWALPRTSHWTATALEDAGFEVREVWTHVFSTGFPKSLDVARAIDARLGAKRARTREVTPQKYTAARIAAGQQHQSRAVSELSERGTIMAQDGEPVTPEAAQWRGFGTATKPATEHWILVRRPLSEGSVAANVLRHGTGGLNIDACRLPGTAWTRSTLHRHDIRGGAYGSNSAKRIAWEPQAMPSGGRFPSTLLLSHGPDCGEAGCGEGCAVAALDAQAGERFGGSHDRHVRGGRRSVAMENPSTDHVGYGHDETGPASRFFAVFPYEIPCIYAPKPSRAERDAGCEHLPDRTRNRVNPGGLEHDPRWAPIEAKNDHPTVKSTALCRWLVRLITPPGGTVLDTFCGSGSVGVACALEGFGYHGMDQSADFLTIAEARIAHAARQAERGKPLLAKTRSLKRGAEGQGSLFGDTPLPPPGAPGGEEQAE